MFWSPFSVAFDITLYAILLKKFPGTKLWPLACTKYNSGGFFFGKENVILELTKLLGALVDIIHHVIVPPSPYI